MQLLNIILQAETYHDYNRDEYHTGEFHVITGTDLEKVLAEAKRLIDIKSEARYLTNSSENEYDIMCSVDGVMVGGDINTHYTDIGEDTEKYIDEREQNANQILSTMNQYEKERNDYWREQYNIKVRAANQQRLEQERIREKAEFKRLQEKYGK